MATSKYKYCKCHADFTNEDTADERGSVSSPESYDKWWRDKV